MYKYCHPLILLDTCNNWINVLKLFQLILSMINFWKSGTTMVQIKDLELATNSTPLELP